MVEAAEAASIGTVCSAKEDEFSDSHRRLSESKAGADCHTQYGRRAHLTGTLDLVGKWDFTRSVHVTLAYAAHSSQLHRAPNRLVNYKMRWTSTRTLTAIQIVARLCQLD